MRRTIALLLLALPLLAQRRIPSCSAEAIALSANWREDTVRDCAVNPKSKRCWQDAVTGAPLFTQANASCRVVQAWIDTPNRPEFIEWLANQKGADGQRLYDSPAWACTAIVTMTLEPLGVDEQPATSVRVWDERLPDAWTMIAVPQFVTDDRGQLTPWPGHGTFTASADLPCFRELHLKYDTSTVIESTIHVAPKE